MGTCQGSPTGLTEPDEPQTTLGQFCFSAVSFGCCVEAGECNVCHPQHFPLLSQKTPLCQCTKGDAADLSDRSSHGTCLALAPGLVMLAQSSDLTTPG